jgi:hypothetical protein
LTDERIIKDHLNKDTLKEIFTEIIPNIMKSDTSFNAKQIIQALVEKNFSQLLIFLMGQL